MKRVFPSLLAFAFLIQASASAAEPGLWEKIKALFSRPSEPAAAEPAAPAVDQKMAAPVPLDPAAEKARHEAAVAESLKAVKETYPAVLEKGTLFNEEFVARLRKLQTENPAAFQRDNWPMELAKNTERSMLLEQYESEAGRSTAAPVGEVVPEAVEPLLEPMTAHENLQATLHLPMEMLEPAMPLVEIPHMQERLNAERRRAFRSYYGANESWRYPSYSNPNYYPAQYYNNWNYGFGSNGVTLNRSVVSPAVSDRVRELIAPIVSQQREVSRTIRRTGTTTGDCGTTTNQDWRSRFESR